MLNFVSTRMYTMLSLIIVNFKWNVCKMWTLSQKLVVIFACAVSLKSCIESLNTMAHNTFVLLQLKNWTVWYMKRFSASTHMGITSFQKQCNLWRALYYDKYSSGWDNYCILGSSGGPETFTLGAWGHGFGLGAFNRNNYRFPTTNHTMQVFGSDA